MILSDKDLRSRIVQSTEEAQKAKEWWKKGEWDKIEDKIVIDPFNAYALRACCYDLSVGEEYLSLRDPENSKPIKVGEHLRIGPGETILILTKEYICLPKNVMSMIIPRAAWIFEGAFLSSTRIDPSWYGKLLIGFTNMAKNPVGLDYGDVFCTCYFMETTEIENVLSPDKAKYLGREKIGSIQFSHAKQQKLMPANKVTEEEIDKVVDLYGWPWDVVRGMFELTRKALMEWIEKEVASDIVTEASAAAERRAFDELTKQYRETTRWTRNLSIGVLTIFGTLAAAIVTAVVGYLIYLFN
ncbi:MAG: hypothetical protein A2Y90_00520 [Chloroflexi bacterium RBG_13_52_12]|nr:MAG: hypothetical protein A2Y90_00520 [Chloroflexi bacterium RBG_13_52_12]